MSDDRVRRRTHLARVGVTALNLIAPGLGIARLGNWRLAVPFIVAPFVCIALVNFSMGHFPVSSFSGALLGLLLLVSLLVALYLVPAVLTWRGSGDYSPARGWSRWYGLTIIAVVVLTLSRLAPALAHRFYRPFYAPSESMAPILGKGDKFIADMMWRGPLRRGEMIIVNSASGIRGGRVVGMAGDRVAMRSGVPIVNGKAASQTREGSESFVGSDGVQSATALTERLPGEATQHRVLDTGPSQFDEMPEFLVPSGYVFILGDNRDRAADSRVPPELGGLGMVPLSAVAGRQLYIYWSRNRSRIGSRLDR